MIKPTITVEATQSISIFLQGENQQCARFLPNVKNFIDDQVKVKLHQHQSVSKRGEAKLRSSGN